MACSPCRKKRYEQYAKMHAKGKIPLKFGRNKAKFEEELTKLEKEVSDDTRT